jgi:hypothetical protein
MPDSQKNINQKNTKKVFKEDLVLKLEKGLDEFIKEEPSQKNLSRKEVVRILSSKIKELRDRGYSFEQITGPLKNLGFDISSSTLQNYYQSIKSKKKNKKIPVKKQNNESSNNIENKIPKEGDAKGVNKSKLDNEELPKEDKKTKFLNTEDTEL